MINKHLVASDMLLAHDGGQTPLEPMQQVAKPAVAVTLNLRLPVLLPQNHHANARPLQFTRQRRPVRLNTTPLAGGKISAPKQLLFKRGRRIDKGFIYKVINHRVYVGEAVYKGTA